MAVRQFDGIDDNLFTEIGTLTGMTYGTIMFLVKPEADAGGNPAIVLSDGTDDVAAIHFDNDASEWWLTWFGFDGTSDFGDESVFTPFTQDWWLVVWRKDTGDVTARMSAYNLNTATWAHSNLNFNGGTVGDWSAPGVSGHVDFQGFIPSNGRFSGRIAARAAWSNSLPWSADASGDTAIEAAGLETALQNWMDNNPSAAWRFNQGLVTEDVLDLTGNGADQTQVDGTTVVAGDDPPGFDFSLGGDQELDVPFHQQITSFFPLTVANQSAQELNVPHHGSEVQIFSPSVANQTSQELNVPHLASSAQLFAPSITTGDHELDVPHLVNVNSFFLPVAENQLAQNLSVGFITSTAQLFVITVENQLDENLSLPFFQNVALLFTPLVFNEGEELFEPTLVGNGTLADRIMEGLIDQGFLTGSIVDREYARLLSKLSLTAPQPKSLDDLYSMAGEDNRILGIGVDVLTPA